MAKKRRVRYDRIVLCVLISILLIAIIVMGIRFILKDDSSDTTNNSDNTSNVIDDASIKIEVSDYVVYEDKNNDLGFNFIVATLKFTGDNGVSYDLANLKTNEDIVLNNILEYSKQLQLASYDFNALGTTTSISSSDNEYSVNIFVPYKEGTSVILTDSLSNASIYLDTTVNKNDIDVLKKQDNSSSVITNDCNISVANNYIASNMYHNGEYYDSSMLNVYVFEMTVNEVKEGISITSATFKQSSTGETWDALDSSYTSSKSGAVIDNILDKTLKVNDSYALFFEVYGNVDDKPDYKGTISLSFSDGSTVTIDTELN